MAQRIKSVEVCNLGHYTVTGGVHLHGLYQLPQYYPYASDR